jgi:tRNA A58 N-methylase Trm61
VSWTSERARLAGTVRHRPDDHEAIQVARRDLRAARLEDHVRRVVGDSPSLTAEQRIRLAALVLDGGDPA